MADLLEKLQSSNDQKKLFHKTKHDLETFREVILITNAVLKWQKKYYPGIIFGLITIFYAILWYMDLSVLTLLSLLLLVITIFDYGFPIISKIVFKPENWSGVEEKKFEGVCQEIVTIKMKITSGYNVIFSKKEEKSTMVTLMLAGGLVFLAWIGSTIDNLFLSYLLSLFIGFYPGLYHNGFIDKTKTAVSEVLGKHFKSFTSKNKEQKLE